MPIYNTGKYLNNSIGSLLNQSINFYKNIQLILVNDGSTDNSEEICRYYRKKYSKNIIYIYKENEGLSSARNKGLKYAKGDYINFLDPDDFWSNNTFKEISIFFQLYPNIDLIAGRMKFFEANTNYHPLDYKFIKTRIIDLNKEYNCIHSSVASAFIRRSAIGNKKFMKGLTSLEDALFVNKLFMNKPFYGVLKSALYFYRRRKEQTSIIQTQLLNDIFYFKVLKSVHQHLLDFSLNSFNKVFPFIQYFIAYDIFFRLISHTFNYLNLSKYIKYIQIIMKLLKRIDDKYILEQKNARAILKIYALSKKYGKDMRSFIKFEDNKLKYHEYNIIEPKEINNLLNLRFIDIKEYILEIEAIDNCWLQRERYYYYCLIGQNIYFPEYKDSDYFSLTTMFGRIIKGRIVSFQIPLKNVNINEKISFYFSYMKNTIEIFPNFGYFCHVPPINNGYYQNGIFILIYDGRRLTLKKNLNQLSEKLENNYCKELERIGKKEIIPIRNEVIEYSKKHKKKKIWLINDHYNKAGDNGESFFRYLKNKNPKDLIFYFVISKNCSDYIRIKEFGNVLSLNSEKYNKTFLKADKIITSTSNEWVYNPFGNDRKYLLDLYHFDLIYLQNGITKDEVSIFLNRYKKNFSIIITASKYEYKSFISSKYSYTTKNIKLTGLSRFDYYSNNENINYIDNIILLYPTWRMYIKGTVKPITYEGIYLNNFNQTDYFKFYNSLMNSPKLLDAMKKYNYKGIFCLHPYFSEQRIDFKNNSLFSIIDKFNLQSLLSQSSLLITDYSSVSFDFAYMKKPIIYTQFDYDEYRKKHYKKDYFDYNLDGFGAVCSDIGVCIDNIIEELKDGCKIKKKYLKRIQKFFAFFDRKNNDRIYNIINTPESFETLNLFQILIYISIIIIILSRKSNFFFS